MRRAEARRPLRLLVAAGGTGGHLYPAIAVAREVLSRDPEAQVTFVGTLRGLETRIVPRAGFPLEIVRVGPLRGGSFLRKLKGALTLPLSAWDALRILKRVRPHVVLGVGGYVSGPMLLVASLAGVPTLLLEPNATPGLANLWLSRFVDAAAVAWEKTAQFFPGKAFVSGNPVRAEIASVPPRTPASSVNVLLFGGSQGSRVLNRAMVAALPHLESVGDRLRVVHQTGEAEHASVKSAYAQSALQARIEPYLDPIEREYREADLVVCRAGATTCAELCAAGRASILIPLPLAGAHQEENARAMAEAGASRVIAEPLLTGERLAFEIVSLLDAPSSRADMAVAARALARPYAARDIAERLILLSKESRA